MDVRNEVQEEKSIDFIKRELIPEMVHDRCFCEAGSREFVELESVSAVPMTKETHRQGELYRANAIVRFSGEPTSFDLLIKLLPSNSNVYQDALDSFQNEEMFYSKMTLQYKLNCLPRCYLANLGKYGRPAIVLEDLEARGYSRIVGSKLDEDHLKLCLDVLGTFHGRGLRLKTDKFAVFREFYAKLLETLFDEESMKHYEGRSSRALEVLSSLPDSKLIERARRKLGENPLETARRLVLDVDEDSTLCHGSFFPGNLYFKYRDGKPIDVKTIDWQTTRHCSPAIDLSVILLARLSSAKLREILTVYVNVVKREYLGLACERFWDKIVDRLACAYVMLSLEEFVTDEDLVEALLRLDELGAFN